MENHKLVHVEGALQRLDLALARLESAAQSAGARTDGAAEAAAAEAATEAVAAQKKLEEKLTGLTDAHAALKETSGRVASRLDAAINRLSAALRT